MNTILQKRIEEKSKELGQMFFPDNMNVFARPNWEAGYIETACKEIAIFALQNQWISVDESLPERNRNVLALKLDGDVIVAFHDGMETWWWCDGFICGEKVNGDKKYSSCCEIASISHWMPIPELKGGEE